MILTTVFYVYAAARRTYMQWETMDRGLGIADLAISTEWTHADSRAPVYEYIHMMLVIQGEIKCFALGEASYKNIRLN